MRLGPVLATALLFTAATSLPACQRASGGPLDPSEGSGVRVEANQVAVLMDGGLEIKVSGRWSSTGANSLRIRYRNGSSAPLPISLRGITMRHSLGEAALRTAVDTTGVDMTDTREDNNQGKMLFSLDEGRSVGTLNLPAGATREIDADLTSFANEGAVTQGDRIAVIVPLATRNAEVVFTAARPSGLP
jgi:hypothetical protein